MKIRAIQSSFSRFSGFTLLEVLVTVLVVSIGLVGLAGLQTVAVRYNHGAYLRNQAMWQSYNILDRMRANKAYAEATGGYAVNLGETISSAQNCVANACSPAQMATYDKYEWKNSLAALLPKGDGAVRYEDVASGRVFIITIQWDDSRGEKPPLQMLIRSSL